MTKEELLERLLRSYQQSFDIEQPYVFQAEEYDAYGAFDVTSAKYVLTKKAELWRAQCYEHVFFKLYDKMTVADFRRFTEQLEQEMEPRLVRQGEKCPPANHMYTYLTGIFICDEVSDDLRKEVKKYKFTKNYRFTIRGYCDGRVAIFDMKNQKIFGNAAGKDIVKGYKKIF